MKQTNHIMKCSVLLFTFALIATSCCSAKQTQTSTAQTPFDKTLVIEDTVAVPETVTENNTPIIQEIPEKPETPEVPATLEVEVPILEPVIEPDTATPEPTIVEIIDHETILEESSLTIPEMHAPFDILLKNNVSSAGNVNYTGFKNNRKALLTYIKALGENVPNDNWTKNEKLAYWMNAYNAMTIDLILRNQPLESIKDIKNPWDQRLWKLGGKWYNLDEIEHQILRKMDDARIHFGINCASFSCPPLLNAAFMPSKVNAQLDLVAKKFINDKSRNMISENSIEISNIFKWFSKDFKQDGSVIDYLNQYSNVQISENAKVRYMDYNWSLNK